VNDSNDELSIISCRSSPEKSVFRSTEKGPEEVHRKKPRLPYPCRKVPTAVHTIGTAHAAPEVPERPYAQAGSCRPIVLCAGPRPEAVPAYVYPAVCTPAVYASGTSTGVRPAQTTALADLPAGPSHGAGRSAGRTRGHQFYGGGRTAGSSKPGIRPDPHAVPGTSIKLARIK
jgi:hypothetical protein